MHDPFGANHMPHDARFDQALAQGTVFDGQYRVAGLLGVGAFGRVYLAEDLRLGRRVALKIVHADAHPDHAALLRSELEVMRCIEHSNIVRLYDFGAVMGFQYLCMEYVEGRNLNDLLHEEGHFELARATNITLQILDALVETQKDGVAHLDLKPQNIIISGEGARRDVVKLVDFGIAQSYRQSSLAARTATSGTPLYMAPEQIRAEPIGPYTDVYAVGLIFFEMLTGYPAFVGEDAVVLMAHKTSVSMRLPAGLAPSPIGATIDRALERSVELRYTHALEMFRDLKLAANSIRRSPIDADTGTSWRKIPTSSGVAVTVTATGTHTSVTSTDAIDTNAQTDVAALAARVTAPKVAPSSATSATGEVTNTELPLISVRRRAKRPNARRTDVTPPLGTSRINKTPVDRSRTSVLGARHDGDGEP